MIAHLQMSVVMHCRSLIVAYDSKNNFNDDANINSYNDKINIDKIDNYMLKI